VKRIDLSLTPGLPAFMDVLQTVLIELCVEEVIIAQETGQYSPERLLELQSVFAGLKHNFVPHTEFKELSKNSHSLHPQW
jgi:D-ribose pyranase